jgi:hypothetical protein
MRHVALAGAFGAMALGLLTGAVLRPLEARSDEIAAGPQLIYSNPRAYGPEADNVGWWSAGSGPVGDWVYGTDWVHPKMEQPVMTTAWQEPQAVEVAITAPAAPATYVSIAPTTYNVPTVDGDVRGRSSVSVWRAQAAAQDGRELGQLGEAAAQRTALNRTVELDNANRPLDPEVDHPG